MLFVAVVVFGWLAFGVVAVVAIICSAMRCPKPISIMDPNTHIARAVPCGQCACCRLNKAMDWTFRLLVEKHTNPSCCFVTFTYDDFHLPTNRSLVKEDLCNLWKRLRAKGLKLRYFACGEYGSKTHRPHYHALIFLLSVSDFLNLGRFRYDTRRRGHYGLIPEWPYGEVFVGDVSVPSISYVCKYTLKKVSGLGAKEAYDDKGLVRPFMVCSRRPAIGSDIQFAVSQNPRHHKVLDSYRPDLPRYYRDKLFPQGTFKRECIDFLSYLHRADLNIVLSEASEESGCDIASISNQILSDLEAKAELYHDRQDL